MNGVASGIVVVELGDAVGAAYGAKLLADYGADVVKVVPTYTGKNERPECLVQGGLDLFEFLDTSKSVIRTDWGTQPGCDEVRELVGKADVVLHSFRRSDECGRRLVGPAHGTSGLVEVAITPCGLSGPYADDRHVPLTVAALGGWTWATGDPGKPPLFPGGPYISFVAGISAASAALIALESRERTGLGEAIDISEMETAAATLVYDTVHYSYSGELRRRTGERYFGNPLVAFYRCTDGYVLFHAEPKAKDFLRLIGGPELAFDRRFVTPEARSANSAALAAVIQAWTGDKPRWQVFADCSHLRIPTSGVPSIDELPSLTPHRSRQFFQIHTAGSLAGRPLPGPPIRFGEGQWRMEGAERGSNRGRDLPDSAPDRTSFQLKTQDRRRRPLEHVRVLELGQGWAGPLPGLIMGSFGADVLKVESIQHPDWWRGATWPGEPEDGFAHERSPLFNSVNHNKVGITLDIASEQGRDLLLKLVEQSDIFIENFTPHVMRQMRLTHEDLARANPDVISISMPAYGSDNPWAEFPAYGTTVESMCGVQSVTGYEGGGPRFQSQTWDPVIGMYATYAAVAALRYRRRTGKGQHIEVSHLEAGTQLVAGALLEYHRTGKNPPRRGNASPFFAPHGCYPTRGSDRWITIAAPTHAEWQALVGSIGQNSDLQSDLFSSDVSRLANKDRLDEVIASLTAAWERDDLFRALQDAGVPAAPVLAPDDLLADAHLNARAFFAPVEREFVGTHRYPGSWIRFERAPARFDRPAPTLGEDNDAVLRERLGLSEEQIQKLADALVIGTIPCV